jgi:uncharacterized protein
VQARIHAVTLAVEDLERAVAFYRGLGLLTPGIVGTEFIGDDHNPGGAAAMFNLDGGLILSLYERKNLAKDAGIRVESPTSGALSLGHLVSSREAVDTTLKEAVSAGAEALAGPHERPWGIYSAYFRDPDGHLWEIIWNPSSNLADT